MLNKVGPNIDLRWTPKIIFGHSLREEPIFTRFLINNFESILDYPYLVRMLLI